MRSTEEMVGLRHYEFLKWLKLHIECRQSQQGLSDMDASIELTKRFCRSYTSATTGGKMIYRHARRCNARRE